MYTELIKSILRRFYAGKNASEDTGPVRAHDRRILGDISTGRGTILIVDDNDMVRGLARSVLESGGYTVFEATNGRDALAICEHSGESIDLLLTDVIMPVMGGRLLAENVEKICPNIAILFMSGFTDDGALRNSIQKDIVNFIHKPFTPDELELKVTEVLDARA